MIKYKNIEEWENPHDTVLENASECTIWTTGY
jgi:hypothetical protein